MTAIPSVTSSSRECSDLIADVAGQCCGLAAAGAHQCCASIYSTEWVRQNTSAYHISAPHPAHPHSPAGVLLQTTVGAFTLTCHCLQTARRRPHHIAAVQYAVCTTVLVPPESCTQKIQKLR